MAVLSALSQPLLHLRIEVSLTVVGKDIAVNIGSTGLSLFRIDNEPTVSVVAAVNTNALAVIAVELVFKRPHYLLFLHIPPLLLALLYFDVANNFAFSINQVAFFVIALFCALKHIYDKPASSVVLSIDLHFTGINSVKFIIHGPHSGTNSETITNSFVNDALARCINHVSIFITAAWDVLLCHLDHKVTLQVIDAVYFESIVIDSVVFVRLRLSIGSLANSFLHLVVDKPDAFSVNEIAGFVTHALDSLIWFNHELTTPVERARHFVSILVVAVKLVLLWEHEGSFCDAFSHVLVLNAHALRIEHETGSIATALNVSVVNVNDKLAFSIILTVYAVCVVIYAVVFVLLRRIVIIVTIFRALITGTAEFTFLVSAQFTCLYAKTACSTTFQIGGSSTFNFPLAENNSAVFALFCEVFRVVIFLIRAINGVSLEEAVLYADSGLPYLVVVFLIFASGELGVTWCIISASLDQLISFLHDGCAQLSSSF